MDLKEMLEGISSIITAKDEVIESLNRKVADLSYEVKVGKDAINALERELAELKTKWDKIQKLFGGIQK